MLKKFSLLLIFALSLSLSGAEKASVLLGRMDVPSLMSVTESLSRITETVSPGSSIMLVMGLTALSFDPKMKDFDLSSNISMCLYSHEQDKKAVLGWCAVFNKKSAAAVDKTDFGKNFFCKEFGSHAVVSDSKELLESLTELPPVPAQDANSDDDEDSGISLYINPQLYIKDCNAEYMNIKNDFLRQLSMRNLKDGDAGLIRSKTAQIRSDYIEKILLQISELKMNIKIRKDAVVLKLNIKPVAGSQFQDFITNQKNSKPVLMPFAKDKTFVASGSFVISDSLRKSSVSMFKDIALELSDDEKNNTYSEIIELLAKNISGSFSFFADMPEPNKNWGNAAINAQSSGNAVAQLDAIMMKKYPSAKTPVEHLYKISDLKYAEAKTLKTFCLLAGSGIIIYEGDATPEAASKLIAGAFGNTEPVDDEYAGSALVFKANSPDGGRSDEITASFTDNSVKMRIYITASTIKSFIPAEYIKTKKNKK